MSSFQELEHTADWAFRVRGRDLKELFANAVRGLASLEGWEASDSTSNLVQEIEVSGYDQETLLVNWLNELLYRREKERASFGPIEILELSDTHLKARVHSRANGDSLRKIKSVTFNRLQIEQRSEGWEAIITVDV